MSLLHQLHLPSLADTPWLGDDKCVTNCALLVFISEPKVHSLGVNKDGDFTDLYLSANLL